MVAELFGSEGKLFANFVFSASIMSQRLLFEVNGCRTVVKSHDFSVLEFFLMESL